MSCMSWLPIVFYGEDVGQAVGNNKNIVHFPNCASKEFYLLNNGIKINGIEGAMMMTNEKQIMLVFFQP